MNQEQRLAASAPMREARIIFASQQQSVTVSASAAEKAREAIAERFGGFTLSQGAGGWVHPKDGLIEEPVCICDIAMRDSAFNRRHLRDIANKYRLDANQYSVYVRYPDGTVEFVEG